LCGFQIAKFAEADILLNNKSRMAQDMMGRGWGRGRGRLGVAMEKINPL